MNRYYIHIINRHGVDVRGPFKSEFDRENELAMINQDSGDDITYLDQDQDGRMVGYYPPSSDDT